MCSAEYGLEQFNCRPFVCEVLKPAYFRNRGRGGKKKLVRISTDWDKKIWPLNLWYNILNEKRKRKFTQLTYKTLDITTVGKKRETHLSSCT